MDLTINISRGDNCTILIDDTTPTTGTGYLAEGSTTTAKNRFKYSQTASIDVLKHNKTTGSTTQTPKIILRSGSTRYSVPLDVQFDGWFSVVHIVLPTDAWFNNASQSEIGTYTDGVYYVKIDNNELKIFRNISGSETQVSVDDIIKNSDSNTTISQFSEDYVSICFLNNCELSLSKEILNSDALASCASKNPDINEMIWRKNLIDTALFVIMNLVKCSQLAEAERIIERIGGCNGLCKNEFRKLPFHKCGCGK